jgi:3-oxoacyl-[acyl-carrier-protein] synthase-3
MPNNVVEHFGNNSGASIPTAIAFNLRERLLHEKLRVCLAGFGAGLTWSAMLLNLGKVDFNTIIEYK